MPKPKRIDELQKLRLEVARLRRQLAETRRQNVPVRTDRVDLQSENETMRSDLAIYGPIGTAGTVMYYADFLDTAVYLALTTIATPTDFSNWHTNVGTPAYNAMHLAYPSYPDFGLSFE